MGPKGDFKSNCKGKCKIEMWKCEIELYTSHLESIQSNQIQLLNYKCNGYFKSNLKGSLKSHFKGKQKYRHKRNFKSEMERTTEIEKWKSSLEEYVIGNPDSKWKGCFKTDIQKSQCRNRKVIEIMNLDL